MGIVKFIIIHPIIDRRILHINVIKSSRNVMIDIAGANRARINRVQSAFGEVFNQRTGISVRIGNRKCVSPG
jgi:hypothetical protein